MLIKRTTLNGSDDITTSFRPCTLDELVGQAVNKAIVSKGLDEGTLAHSTLLIGPTGCGKTTMARIMSLGLSCTSFDKPTSTPCLNCEACRTILNRSNFDVREIDCGTESGKNEIIQLLSSASFSPFQNRYKIFIFDEAQELSKAAQGSLLKKIEDGFRHVYYIFCTNNPNALIPTLLSRLSLSTLNFGSMDRETLLSILINICEYEGATYSTSILNKIIEVSEGSARTAIGKLKMVLDEGSWSEEAASVILDGLSAEATESTIKLFTHLINKKFMASVAEYGNITKLAPESIRCSVVGLFVYRLTHAKANTSVKELMFLSNAIDVLLPVVSSSSVLAKHDLVNRFFKICAYGG